MAEIQQILNTVRWTENTKIGLDLENFYEFTAKIQIFFFFSFFLLLKAQSKINNIIK